MHHHLCACVWDSSFCGFLSTRLLSARWLLYISMYSIRHQCCYRRRRRHRHCWHCLRSFPIHKSAGSSHLFCIQRLYHFGTLWACTLWDLCTTTSLHWRLFIVPLSRAPPCLYINAPIHNDSSTNIVLNARCGIDVDCSATVAYSSYSSCCFPVYIHMYAASHTYTRTRTRAHQCCVVSFIHSVHSCFDKRFDVLAGWRCCYCVCVCMYLCNVCDLYTHKHM